MTGGIRRGSAGCRELARHLQGAAEPFQFQRIAVKREQDGNQQRAAPDDVEGAERQLRRVPQEIDREQRAAEDEAEPAGEGQEMSERHVPIVRRDRHVAQAIPVADLAERGRDQEHQHAEGGRGVGRADVLDQDAEARVDVDEHDRGAGGLCGQQQGVATQACVRHGAYRNPGPARLVRLPDARLTPSPPSPSPRAASS